MKFYAHPQSPPCRAVHMTLAVLGKEAEYVFVDLLKGAHKEPDFLKLNPQHNVPVLVDDDGFTLNESRAIQEYLVHKYGSPEKIDQLLGDTPKTKAMVQQKLNFDASTFWYRFVMNIITPQVFQKEKEVSQANKEKLHEVFNWMEDMIKPTGYIAGTKNMTIADISVLATVTTVQTTKDCYVDWSKYPELVKWVDRMKNQIPNYAKANQEGVDIFEKFFSGVTGLI